MKKDVAVILGGAETVFAEFAMAQELCWQAAKTYENLVVNDMIAEFPDVIDNAVTLHPDKFTHWIERRTRNRYPPIRGRIWGHREFVGTTHATPDWGGSVGLFAVKIAREQLGYEKILLCGVPMAVEDDHFVRHTRWPAAHGFRRAWTHRIAALKPYVRSFSGWSAEQLGTPHLEWLR